MTTARVGDLIEDARGRAADPDPGRAFFGFLGRIGQEAAAKRDLPDAIAVAGSLQEDLHAALDVLLTRAQRAGAVRADITTLDLVVLLKGLLRSVHEAPAGPDLPGRLLAVLSDGLRPRPEQPGWPARRAAGWGTTAPTPAP